MPYFNQDKMVSDEIKKLTPVLGKPTVERLEKAYLLGNEKIKERIIEMVDITKAAVFSDAELRDSVLMEPPEKSLSGEIKLGEVIYGKKRLFKFAIDKDQLLTHMGIFGSSGYGKTNISYCMIKQLSESGIPVIVFDFSKRNYKDMLGTELRDRIDIYTVGKNVAPLRFNPLVPPKGIDTVQWMKEFASIFDHAYWLLGGGTHVITKALDSIYSEKKKPRLQDLSNRLDEFVTDTPRERNWLSTAKRPLDSLCMKGIGEIFNCDEGTKPSEFFVPGRITVLELDALSTNDKTFFIEIMLQWIRDWLLVGNKREELTGVVILEEAHHILNREKAKKLGAETVIDLVFREVRELGLGIVYIDQHPSLVSYPALGNTSTHVYMNLGLDTKYSSDIDDAANMLGLTDEESTYLRQLPVGNGFVLMRRSDFTKPFTVKFDEFALRKGSVNDNDIERHMEGKIIREEKSAERLNVPLESLDENCLRVIKALGVGKGYSTSGIYKALKMSGTTFADSVSKLKKLGLIDSKEVRVKNSKGYYYFLTDAGESLFEKRFPAESVDVYVNKNDVLEIFKANGWQYCSKNENNYVLSGNGTEINLTFLTSVDRERIYKDLRDGFYYIAATDEIANIVIQQAAKHAKVGKFTLYLAIYDEFKNSYGFQRLSL
jgi:predicted transcriptional regulator